MGHKHLHELLKEDQEPFQLKSFIADRRRSNLKSADKTSLNVRKRKPIIESSSSSATARSFCINHVCLFSFQDSPEFRKSPFLNFPTREIKSPSNHINNNTPLFLHVPARTAAMLLDAATRVQKPKPNSKQIGFGLFGSLLRRLKDRSAKTKSHELGPPVIPPTAKRSRKKTVNGVGDEKRLFNCGNDCRISGGDWSEKSPEMETSCSLRSIHEFEEIDECFCSNPSSPFRFSLHRSPSPTRRKQGSSSPAASPSRHVLQVKEICEVGSTQEIHREEDEEKEQCSPISVLDPLFSDDEEQHDNRSIEDDSYDIECTYASVQRAKHQLLQKLQRFERLAGLDPIKLENYMLEQCYIEDEEDALANGGEASHEESVKEVVNHLGVGKIPWYMKKLVSDLIEEENKNKEHHVMVQRVCKRLHSWKVVELNTIDMMVGSEFESEGWMRCHKETTRDVGKDIEVAIFGFLMEELAQELVGNVVF